MSHQRAERIEFAGAAGNRIVGDIRRPEGVSRDAGQGSETSVRVVLLAHGGGQTRHSWERTARQLADMGLVAITIDQRGHGDSDWVEDGRYHFVDYGADIVAVARQITEKFGHRPVAIGASLGGIASTIAEGEAPGLLRALVLVDVVPRLDPNGVSRITGFMAERMREGFATVEEAAEAVAAYLPQRRRPKSTAGLRKNLRLGDDGRYRWHWDPRFIDGPHDVGSGAEAGIARMEEAARGLRLPVLLVRGGQSELVPEESARHFMELVPHAEYRDVSGAGHMVAGDRNDAFSDAVVDFLQALQAM